MIHEIYENRCFFSNPGLHVVVSSSSSNEVNANLSFSGTGWLSFRVGAKSKTYDHREIADKEKI